MGGAGGRADLTRWALTRMADGERMEKVLQQLEGSPEEEKAWTNKFATMIAMDTEEYTVENLKVRAACHVFGRCICLPLGVPFALNHVTGVYLDCQSRILRQ